MSRLMRCLLVLALAPVAYGQPTRTVFSIAAPIMSAGISSWRRGSAGKSLHSIAARRHRPRGRVYRGILGASGMIQQFNPVHHRYAGRPLQV